MKTLRKNSSASCGCSRCRCASRCSCHALNALIALTLWDISRTLRRSKARN